MSTTDADLPALLYDAIREVLMHHRLSYTEGQDAEAFPLLDMLCPPGSRDIAKGADEVTLICDAIYNDEAVRAAIEADRARSQPAPSVAVPYSAIGKLLVQAIEQAVRNGANSVSMPDEYVAIAAWLAASPQPPTQQEKS